MCIVCPGTVYCALRFFGGATVSKYIADMICCNKPQDERIICSDLLWVWKWFCGALHCLWFIYCLTTKKCMFLTITSVCRMAARCSLAVRDSFSTSICCLQSEFWLLRVSSFVCRASSSDSFFDNSCFSWSIYRHVRQPFTWALLYHHMCARVRQHGGKQLQLHSMTIFINALHH